MKNITTVGIDIAKEVFQIHAADRNGKKIFAKRVSRKKLMEEIAKLPPCLIGMEACGGAHYWARRIKEFGHDVRLISPQYVKPYVKTNKNDARDAEAICEAVTRPGMRFVSIKSIEQQDMQTLHRIRSVYVGQRTAQMNQIRGILLEYGIAINRGKAALYRRLSELLSTEDTTLPTDQLKRLLAHLDCELRNMDELVETYTKKVKELAKHDERCIRLQTIPGVGPLTATALLASINEGSTFKNGRNVSAWLGVVPKQCSSGQTQRLLGISKRGNRYLRSLFIHGARAVVSVALKHKETELMNSHTLWICQLVTRCGINKAVVALANKNIRIAWAILKNVTTFNPTLAHA